MMKYKLKKRGKGKKKKTEGKMGEKKKKRRKRRKKEKKKEEKEGIEGKNLVWGKICSEKISVADPDPYGSVSFGRIRIRFRNR